MMSVSVALTTGAVPTHAATVTHARRNAFDLAVLNAPVSADDRAVEEYTNAALDELSAKVTRRSSADALKLAFHAYYAYRAEHPELVKKPYLYYVDYGLDNRTARGYVFDMEDMSVVEGPFIVAHGRDSAYGKDGIPMKFSNSPGSAATSLGLYVTGETYSFTGHSGGGTYSSIGLRLDGVSGRFNSTARSRGVVVHGAPYVTPSGSGRSEGCPAMEQARAHRLIPKIANGSLVFLFSPFDGGWLRDDPWMGSAS
jgi:hypothetical protein